MMLAQANQLATVMTTFDNFMDLRFVQDFVHKIRSEDSIASKQYFERLSLAGCVLHQAVLLKDVAVLEGLLQRGSDINLRDHQNRTALEIAVETNNFEMVKILVGNGADLCTRREFGGPLCYSALNGNVPILQLLLKAGSAGTDPSHKHPYLPLLAAFTNIKTNNVEQLDAYAAILLQHGVMPKKARPVRMILGLALNKERWNGAGYLIAHLAIISTPTMAEIQSYLRLTTTEEITVKMEEVYKLCQQTLKIVIFEKSSLHDLLTQSEYKMKLRVRNATFSPTVTEICSEYGLNKLCPYYYDTLMKRIVKATHRVNLEDEAVSIISKIFKKSYNECYLAARLIFDYLSERDLESLCEV